MLSALQVATLGVGYQQRPPDLDRGRRAKVAEKKSRGGNAGEEISGKRDIPEANTQNNAQYMRRAFT